MRQNYKHAYEYAFGLRRQDHMWNHDRGLGVKNHITNHITGHIRATSYVDL